MHTYEVMKICSTNIRKVACPVNPAIRQSGNPAPEWIRAVGRHESRHPGRRLLSTGIGSSKRAVEVPPHDIEAAALAAREDFLRSAVEQGQSLSRITRKQRPM